MSASRPSARRQPRKPPKLAHDLDRPDADPEEIFDVHSISSDDDDDDDDDSGTMPSRTRPAAATPARASQSKSGPSSQTSKQQQTPQDVIEISTDGSVGQADDVNDEMDMSDFEDVDPAAAPATADASRASSEDLDMEDVELDADQSAKDLQHMYAAAYREVQAKYGDGTGEYDGVDDDQEDQLGDDAAAGSKPIPIFKDGKGQHRGVEISVGSRTTKQTASPKQKSNNFLTPRDRQNRITAHKLLVLSMLAHTRVRNKWCNDDELRDALAESVPDYLITKLRSIHPKKVAEQRERIRMFESFLSELVRWWSARFRLDPTMVANSALRQPDQDIATGVIPSSGRRIDGWIVETASEREQRHRRERREQQRYKEAKERQAKAAEADNANGKGKGKARARDAASTADLSSLKPPTKAMEITIFAPGSAIRPIYMRLLPATEHITSPAGLKQRAEERSGSRETSAQLFCALCRSIGIPARLVVSPQPLSWSVGASKLANTAQPGSQADKKPSQLRSRVKSSSARRFASKPVDELTSDDEDGNYSASGASRNGRGKAPRQAISVDSQSSADEATASDVSTGKQSARTGKASGDLTKRAVLSAAAKASSTKGATGGRGGRSQPIAIDDTTSDISSGRSANGTGHPRSSSRIKETASAKGKGKARQLDEVEVQSDDLSEDYRPEKWRNLKAPLKVEPKVKLRAFRPKQLKASEVAGEDTTADPVDLQAPPTMWVEVFSKPYQKWITVDPVRSMIQPSGNRHMEPPAFDRQNKLVYVVAFEEDGYARDVTARYTKTLNSRVSRLRPPTRVKGEEDWWSRVVRAIHRPQKLDRDAMEDAELQDNSSREPMPTSMNGFKDHPVYFLEKFLKRDEVVFPRRQIATFQGTPVFSKSDVQTLRSSRQWYNEGRVVKDGEVALKFVKARGYTLANKRAEEQARLEGREVAQEGLYAEFQTQLYVPPPVGADGIVPTNGFGNIDLFVPSMLPAGAAHLPFNGVAKVAKKIGVPYAEAITGFEFRKQRGMPKITGIVVAQQNAELVEEAFWQQEQQDALKQQTKKMERAMKNWRKLINAVRIAKRVKEQYGDKMVKKDGSGKKVGKGGGEEREQEQEEKSRFFTPKQVPDTPQAEVSVAAADAANATAEDLDIDPQMPDTPEPAVDSPSSSSTPAKRKKIISLAQLASSAAHPDDDDDGSSSSIATPSPPPPVDTPPSKRQRRAATTTRSADADVEEPTTASRAKRPRRSAAATAAAAEVDTPARRSTRARQSTSVYVEPDSDVDSDEEKDEDDALADPEPSTRRTSRRLTVKLAPRKRS